MTDFLCLFLAVGCAALMLRQVTGKPVDRLLLVALSPAIGLGSLSIGTFGLLVLGFKLNPLSIAAGYFAVLLYLGLISRARSVRDEEREPPPTSPRKTLPLSLRIVLVATSLFLLWAGQQWIQSWPHGSADAVNIWTSRGEMLARADGSFAERFSMIKKGHPDYPLLLPSILAAQFGAHESYSLTIPATTGLILFASLLGATWFVVSRFSNSTYGAMAAAIVAVNPLIIRWAFAQCADIPLSYFFLLSAGGLAALGFRGARPKIPPALTGFFIGLLLWTKNEGAVAALVLMVLAALFAVVSGRTRTFLLSELPFLVLGLAPGAISLLVFRRTWLRDGGGQSFLGPEWLSQILDTDRWWVVVTTVFDQAVVPRDMAMSAIVALVLAATAVIFLVRSRTTAPRPAVFLITSVFAMSAAFFAAYVLSPYELEWHIIRSVDRLIIQMTPVLVAGATILFASARESTITSGGDPVDVKP